MLSKFGFSLYISNWEDQIEMLDLFRGSGYYVFTSFHIEEEYHTINDYQQKAISMCKWLKEADFKIIGDVSQKTLQFFKYSSLVTFAKDFDLDILRIDYGFSEDEIIMIAKAYPISFNPSTEGKKLAEKIGQIRPELSALHNFYPRPETGLDSLYFDTINQNLKRLMIKVMAFIPGDGALRGPIYSGLPTLEKHRNYKPYIAFLDIIINHKVDCVFIGDQSISTFQSQLIMDYIKDEIIQVPVTFHDDYSYLINQVFTIRKDSPILLMRLQESREYATKGQLIEPFNCIERKKGSITMDNTGYKRYSGEIQILKDDFLQDDRVNIIGKLDEQYIDLLTCIKNGSRIRLIQEF